MVEFIEGWMDKGLGPSKSTKLDPLGNSMVESSRQLSGLKLKTKPPKKPKKPKALKETRGKAQKLKGRGPGGKTSRSRKSSCGKAVNERAG